MNAAERIFVLLHEKHLTAKNLADYVGVSTGNVSDWKAGRSKPSMEVLPKIAQYLGVTNDYLLTGSEPLPKDLSAEEAEWLEVYRKLEPSAQIEYRAELKGYVKAKEKTNKD